MHDSEWLRILISALAGMLTGLIADPIRGAFSRDLEIYRLRRAISLDLLSIITGQAAVKHGLATASQFWALEMFPSFSYYWEQNREYFYSDFILHAVRMQIQTAQLIQASVQSGETAIVDGELKLEKTMKPLKEILLEKKPHRWEGLKRRLFAKLH